ncbi:MAG: hypothetical protein IIU71_05985 [Selenomonadaceae bacterium]|nr:hypothetical protein [Selenomonadaceae bacterium]
MELGYINWTMHRTNFEVGDIVFLFMSDERKVAFKTKVVAKNCDRTDIAYWQVKPNMHFTYKLELVKEYTGNKLDEENLTQHGFKGGRSIQHPLKNNVELLSYINSVFEDY